MKRDLSRSLKRSLTAWTARRVRRPRLTPGQLLALRPERILVVRQQNQMGDMVCATPVFRALRETWPEAEIGLVTAPVNVQVVRHNPHIDRIFLFEQQLWRSPRRLLALRRELRDFGAELAFVLASVSFSVTSAALGLASGARHVVGADSEPFGLDLSRHAFSLEMPSNPEITGHAIEHGLAPLRSIGISTDDLSTVVVPSPGERQEAGRILDELGLQPGYWAVHPGAGKRQNLWPAEGFAAVIRRAIASGHRVLMLHGPADAEAVAALRGLLAHEEGRGLVTAPACTVGVGAALLQRSERFLCNDTGVMHIAGALGVPTVALFGPTDPARWKPPGERMVVVRSPRRSNDERGPEYGWMENIDSEVVWNTWSELPARAEEKPWTS